MQATHFDLLRAYIIQTTRGCLCHTAINSTQVLQTRNMKHMV